MRQEPFVRGLFEHLDRVFGVGQSPSDLADHAARRVEGSGLPKQRDMRTEP